MPFRRSRLKERRIAVVVAVTAALVVFTLLLGIASPKSVHAAVSMLITVANNSSNPIPVQSIDNPARHAVVLTNDLTIVDGHTDVSAPLAINMAPVGSGGAEYAPYIVPAVQRLVIDSITGYFNASPN
jgi:hypothetical protein